MFEVKLDSIFENSGIPMLIVFVADDCHFLIDCNSLEPGNRFRPRIGGSEGSADLDHSSNAEVGEHLECSTGLCKVAK